MGKYIHIFGPSYIDHTIRLKDKISLDGSSRIEREETYPGGTGLCYAIALSRLENKVKLHSIIGTDYRAKLIQNSLDNENNIHNHIQIKHGSTDYAHILIDNGNHKVAASRRNISNSYDVDKINPEILKNAKAIVLTSFDNMIYNKILTKIKNNNINTFILWAPHISNCKHSKTLLPFMHVIKHITLSVEEYKAMYKSIGNPVNHGVKSITVTNGKNGCDLITKNGHSHFKAVRVVHNALDTNGAGEAFGSGFLTSIIETNNYNYAVRAGSYVGYCHIHKYGSDFPYILKGDLIKIAKDRRRKVSSFSEKHI